MTTTLARKIVWGTVALTALLFAFVFIYTGATWDTVALKNAGLFVLGVVAIASVPAFGAWLLHFGSRYYTLWNK